RPASAPALWRRHAGLCGRRVPSVGSPPASRRAWRSRWEASSTASMRAARRSRSCCWPSKSPVTSSVSRRKKFRTSARGQFMTKAVYFVVLTWCAFAQDRLQFDWDKLAAKASEKVNVTLEGATLELASRFLSGGDETKIKQMVQGLKGVYVRSFTFEKE